MTAVTDAWVCSVCASSFVFVVALAAHVVECHDDWLRNRIPPPCRVSFQDQEDDYWEEN